MLRRYLTLLLLFLATLGVTGQTCGFTDTVRVDDPGANELVIPITDYLNNDLGNAGQGLCEVTLFFEHSYVYDLTVDLTSPGGQTVQLIGPDNDQTRPPTIRARWFIDFERCDSTAAPDAGAPGQWDNDFPFDWPAFSVQRGDYFPHDGCLEDFNSGPVNGNWTINFNNFRSNEQARVTYILLTFCDDLNARGPCCFADAGVLDPDPVVEACVTDPPTAGIPPRYGRPRPPADEYAYTYLISRDGQVVGTDPTGDLTGYPPGNYQVCGFSFRDGELGSLVTDGTLSLADLRADLESITPTFCGNATTDCQEVILFAVPDTVEVSAVICLNDSYLVGSTRYNTTGIFNTTLTGRGGCDSIVRLDLLVVDELFAVEDTTICFGAAYPQGSNVYTTPGTYVDTLLSVAGCDSIVTLNLDIADRIVFDTTAVLCAGDAFIIGSESFTTTTVVSRTIPAVNGCDSTVNLDLLVLDPEIVAAPTPTELTCDTEVILLDVTASRFDFVSTFQWLDALGNPLGVGLTLPVTAAGTYIFELTDAARGLRCAVRDTFVITDARFAVDLALARSQVQGSQNGSGFVLDCRSPDLGIVVDVLPTGVGYDYAWTGSPGSNIVSGSSTPTIVVSAGGTYRVRVEDPVTGCFSLDSVEVVVDSLLPLADIEGLELLNCENTELILRADTLQPRRDELTFDWVADCLSLTSTIPTLSVTCPGTIRLTVENTTNGCRSDSVVNTEQDRRRPSVDLAPATPPLSCYFPERELVPASATSASGSEFVWQLAGVSDTLSRDSSFTTERAGNFRLTVTDTRSRCSVSATIEVPADTLRPPADSGPDTLTLNCYTPSHLLGGNGGSDPDVRYSWVQISTPEDTLSFRDSLRVNDPGGFFRFEAFDVGNGCRSLDSTRVLLELDTPFIRLDLPFDFDCFTDSLQLNASRTSRNFPNSQNWTGPCVSSDPDSSRVWVECSGTYVYELTNLRTGCVATDSVTVEIADNSVQAILADSAFIDCDTGETRLDRRLGSDAPIVEWYRDGQRVNLVGMQPRVTVPGSYTLILGNFNGSCRDTATTEVVAICPALAIIVPHEELNCRNNTVVMLDARPSIPGVGPNVTVEWLTPAGASFLPGDSERELIVFSAGRYGFVVNNLISGAVDTVYTEVGIDITPPVVEAGESDTITCRNPVVFLDGSASDTLGNFSYVWSSTTEDTIGLDYRVPVSEPGLYFLRVTNEGSGCSRTDNVTMFRNVAVPDLSFTSVDLPCDTVDFPLGVMTSEPGMYRYRWSGNGIIDGATSDTVRISDAGRYGVTVTSEANGCPVAGGVLVTRLPCPPFPFFVDTTLTCDNPSIVIAPGFRDPCVDCTYRWRLNGRRLIGETDSTLVVTEPGDYRLDVTNLFNLSASVITFVSDSRILPAGNAGPDRELSCDSLSVQLGAPTSITGFPFTYRWLDGTLADLGGRAPTFRATAGGVYQLETTNTFSGCVGLDTVLVTYDTIAPTAAAGPLRILTCNEPRKVLDGLGSSLGNRFRYQWTGGGSPLCLEGATTLSPIARCDGLYTLRVTDTRNGCVSTAEVAVAGDDELPLLVPLADTTVNCYSDSVLLNGAPPGGRNQVYLWERIDTDPDLPLPDVGTGRSYVSETGTYRFSVTDTLTGCGNSFELDVTTDFGLPIVEAGLSDTFFCELDSLVLDGLASSATGGPVNYRWSSPIGFQVGNATSTNPTIYQPDSYVLTAFDPLNGCRETDTVHILRDIEAPVVEAGRDTSLDCELRSIRLNGGAVTLSGQREFSWSTRTGNIVSGAGQPGPTVDAAGTYLLEVRDPVNDCSSGDVVRVTEDTIAPRARLAEDVFLINCNLRTVTLDGRPSTGSGRGLNYRWVGPPEAPLSGSPDRAELAATAPGPYQLIVTDAGNSCQDTTGVTVRADFRVPSVTIDPPRQLTCVTDSVRLAVPLAGQDIRFAYRWFRPDQVPIATVPAFRVGRTGTYLLETRNVINGCRDTTTVTVTEDRVPPTVSLSTPEPLNCSRTVSTIDGTESSRGGRFRPRWSSPGSTGIPTGDPFQLRGREPGTYVLTVTNTENGCVSSSSTVLEQRAIAVDGLEIEVEQPACELDRTGAVEIVEVTGGTAPFRYRLDGGILTDRLYYDDLPVGRHTVAVIDADGCTEETEFTLEPGRKLEVELRADTTIRLGDSLPLDFTLNAPSWDTLIWTSEGPLPPLHGDGPLTVRPFLSQSFRLTVLDENGCSATDNVTIEVDETIDLFIPNAFSPNGDAQNDFFRPYPGPQVAAILQMRIFDRWGEQLYDLADDPLAGTEAFGWRGEMNGRPLNPAVFVYQILVRLVDGEEVWYHGDLTLLR